MRYCEKDWRQSEIKFREWLNRHRLNFVWINQEPESKPVPFVDEKIKRPDLFIWPDPLSKEMIAIDVKDHTVYFDPPESHGPMKPYFLLSIESDVLPLKGFEEATGIPVWLAFKDTLPGKNQKKFIIWRFRKLSDCLPDSDSSVARKIYANKFITPRAKNAEEFKALISMQVTRQALTPTRAIPSATTGEVSVRTDRKRWSSAYNRPAY